MVLKIIQNIYIKNIYLINDNNNKFTIKLKNMKNNFIYFNIKFNLFYIKNYFYVDLKR